MSNGTVMIFVSPEGRVIAHAADFSRTGPAGFSAAQFQELRCKRELDVAVFNAFASPVLTDAADDYERGRIVTRLENKGYRRHTITVEVPTREE